MTSHLDIEVVGKGSLAVPLDQSIDIEEYNPMFHDIEMLSLPAQLPFDHNRGVFKNMDDRDSNLRAIDVEGEVSRFIVDGLPFRSTVLHIQEDEVLKDRISVNFDSRTKSFKDMISNLKCRDVKVKDKIQIGEKIGRIYTSFTYRPVLNITYNGINDPDYDISTWKQKIVRGDWATKSAEFTPPVLGFSYPGIRDKMDEDGTFAEVISYTNPTATVKIPKLTRSFINTSLPYPQAKYCNSRICYAHHAYDAEKEDTSDDIVDPTDDGQRNNNGYGAYWVLDAYRPASGICFYMGYFLECLFDHLGVDFDMSALTDNEDFNYLAFFTTACKFTEELKMNMPGVWTIHLKNEAEINKWLDDHGCGGQVKFDRSDTESATSVDEYTINGVTYHVGDIIDNPDETDPSTQKVKIVRLLISIEYGEFDEQAELSYMYATSDNFPDATVTEVIESLENSFGCRFDYDPETNKVKVYLLRDVFRQKDVTGQNKTPIQLNAKIHTMYKLTEKITGVRVKYSDESDEEEQRQNIREGKRDYDTDYDYIEYPEGRTVIKSYKDIVKKIDATDMGVYVDTNTGNAIRIKIDKDATTGKEMKPVAFEVGQYHGVEFGDCSDENEDYVQELTSSFQPINVNDVNFRYGGTTNPKYQPLLVPYIDEDMEREFVPFELKNPFIVEDNEIYFTYVLSLAESYDPSGTDDGQSPLMSHDWGLAIGILRTGDGGKGVENYDQNYDGFGNWRWRDIADEYCIASDTMDQTGLWLGKTDHGKSFSLKIRAWKPFLYYIDENGQTHVTSDMSLEGKVAYTYQDGQGQDVSLVWTIPCIDDERTGGVITRRIKSRGLADTFLSEYIYFLLNRQKYRITADVEIAQLADIKNHWRDCYEIDGKIGYIDRLRYSIHTETGIGEVEIDFFTI